MKYNVGDKVKIREDLNCWRTYGGFFFTDEMECFRGKICTIKEVLSYSLDALYKLKEDDSEHFWTNEMIEGKVSSISKEDLIRASGIRNVLRYSDEEISFMSTATESYSDQLKEIKDYINDCKKEEKDMRTITIQKRIDLDIKEIKIIVPNKVVEVFFTDGLKEKMVCHEDDTFDLRNCLFLALAKHMYKDEYTLEGIEYKANEMKLMKKYVKIVDSALKLHKKKEEEIANAKKKEEEVKAIAEKKKAKLAKYKAKCKEKYRQKHIDDMTTSIVNAFVAFGKLTNDYENKCHCDCGNDCVCDDDLK